METVKLLHIIGYKNSGKTTLISNWVRTVKAAGLKVVVIKHHGHGAKLAMPDERKDSMQYLVNGADASIVSGAGYTQHISNEEMDYDSLLELAQLKKPDVIFVEGYKNETGEKVVLIKEEVDWDSLQHTENIRLVIGLQADTNFPQVDHRENKESLNSWLKEWLTS